MNSEHVLSSGISVSLRGAVESDDQRIDEVFRKRTGMEPHTLQPGIKCVVAEVGGQIVAYGYSYGNTIKNLCRLEGSHLSGTADLILESLEKIVRDEGFIDVCLYAQPAETDYPLEKLVRFYKRHGYEVNTSRQGFSIDAKPVNLGAEMIKRF